MSYILDALRKSEAERARAAAPDLFTPAQSGLPGAGSLRSANRIWMVLALLATGALAWVLLKPNAGSVAAPAPPVLVSASATVPSAATTPKAEPRTAPLPVAAAKPQSKIKPEKPMAKTPSLARTDTFAVEKQVVKPEPSAATETPVATLRELPDHLQKEIPTIAFSGYLYSGNAADRSVLIGNRLLREGDQVAPGITLEKMLPKEAVLNYSGVRFRVPY